MKNKAIFLDRDGVLNREKGRYTYSVADFEVLEGVKEALAAFSAQGYMLIVITNQGGVAKRLYHEDDLEKMQVKLREETGADFAELYYCPHHPTVSKCLCRKPEPLMLQKALARFDIDASASFFIGDTDRDMEAAAGAGVKGIKVEPNADLRKVILA